MAVFDNWQAIDKAVSEVEPPADAFSTLDFANHRGITRDTAKGLINKLIATGVIQFVRKYRGHNYYRLVDK